MIKILAMTYRYKVYGQENVKSAISSSNSQSFIMAFWHENYFNFVTLEKNISKFITIVSISKDGNYGASLIQNWGVSCARGSSSRNGLNAKNHMISAISAGEFGAVAIDGPKGPRHRAKKGIIEISKKTQSDIIPFGSHSQRCWALKSWDQFKIPKPFAKVVLVYGAPMKIHSSTPLDEYIPLAQELEKRLFETHKIAVNKSKEWL